MKQEYIEVPIGGFDLLERPAGQLLNDFGSGKASPGSGSAAALLSILAAKMVVTVCSISLRKDDCINAHKTFEFISKKVISDIEPRLRFLFEQDAKDFERVVALRVQRDKSTDANEKAQCSRDSFDLLQTATDYTFEVAELSLELMGFGVAMFDHGWHAVRGDAGVAISAAMSGVMSSIFIINLNLKTLRRRKYASENLKRCERIQNQLEELQMKAFSCVALSSAESLKSIQLELVSGEV